MSYIGTPPKDVRSFGKAQFDFTATQGQTVFTGADDDSKTLGFTEGQIQVHVNGVLLDESDYSTSNSNTVTLASAANVNDILTVLALQTDIPNSNYVPSSGGTFSGDVSFGDNDKAIFGAGSDLSIYHETSTGNSRIVESGSGHLNIEAANLNLKTPSGENYINCNENGNVLLRYDNEQKLSTTSTGVDITGTLTSDGLTVDKASSPAITLQETTGTYGYKIHTAVSSSTDYGLRLRTLANKELAIFNSNGDVSFYEDTGTTAKFFWDASAESLGLGATSFSGETLRMERSGDMILGLFSGASSSTFLNMGTTSNRDAGQIGYTQSSNHMFFRVNDAERMRIDSSGNVLVGKASLGIANAGHTLAAGGYTEFTRTATSTSTGGTLNVGRNSYDGQLATFWKDGATVGSISTIAGFTVIGSGDTGILFDATEDAIKPRNSSTASRDAAINLGGSGDRFKDLYLSGGVYLGGVGSSNKLDDYEEGTWTPTIGSGTAFLGNNTYVKIGKQVVATLYATNFSDTTSSTSIVFGGLPYASDGSYIQGSVSLYRYVVPNNSGHHIGIYGGGSSTAVTLYACRTNTSTYEQLVHNDLTASSANFFLKIIYNTNS